MWNYSYLCSQQTLHEIYYEMLKPYKIADYISEYKPEWACTMPDGCPPEDVLVAEAHPTARTTHGGAPVHSRCRT